MISELVFLSLSVTLIFCQGLGIASISYALGTDTTERDPIRIISDMRSLLSQIQSEYENQNYTGASILADDVYLENYELIEVPLKKQNDTLMQETELMLREELRDLVKTRDNITGVLQLIDRINSNLDDADTLLTNQSGK
ncbi:MAG: hypothetical protein ACRD97_01705 [Nitrososphaeraceae archaeon]